MFVSGAVFISVLKYLNVLIQFGSKRLEHDHTEFLPGENQRREQLIFRVGPFTKEGDFEAMIE